MPTESRSSVAELVSFLVAEAVAVDAAALPLGWVQDNTDSMWSSMTHVVTKLLHVHSFRGNVEVLPDDRKVRGFYVGVDPKHVEWRLQEALNCSSADFVRAAWALRVLFARVFNFVPDVLDAVQSQDDTMSVPAPGHWLEAWRLWLANARIGKDVAAGRQALEHYLSCRKGLGADRRVWREDGAIPPRCVLTIFLCTLGCKDETAQLWCGGQQAEELYCQDLAEFKDWFAVPMVTRQPFTGT